MTKLLPLFRITAVLEGLSYILLLFIAVPFKYLQDDPQFVKMLGMPHGLFFMAYIVLAVMLGAELKWPNKTLFIALVAAIIPFGTFYINKKYLRNENT